MRRLPIVVLMAAVAGGSLAPSASARPRTRSQETNRTAPVPADLNGDGRSDLVVGVPGEDHEDLEGAGAVNVIYSGSEGLSSERNQLLSQGIDAVAGFAESGANLGRSIAIGDFDGDGFDDLAAGAPGTDVMGVTDAGQVLIVEGSKDGLVPGHSTLWHQGVPNIEGELSELDSFGASLATGDFNGDGYSDLAVGAHQDEDRGAVQILYGSGDGLSSDDDQIWTQDSDGVRGEDNPSTQEFFGYQLAVANFGRGKQDDLAIGAPGEVDDGAFWGGAVHVLFGSDEGVTAAGNQYLTQDVEGVADQVEDSDRFGYSLAAANFGKSRHADLAIGVPNESLVSWDEAGAVHVVYGSKRGLRSKGSQYFHQDRRGLADYAEDYDLFGRALAAGFFGGGRHADLAVGVPSEDFDGAPDAGAVHVLIGSERGLSPRKGSFLKQPEPETDDQFGYTMTTGNYGRGPSWDLAVAAPGESIGELAGAGEVGVFYGSRNGRYEANGFESWNQDSDGIMGEAASGDFFGDSFPLDFD